MRLLIQGLDHLIATHGYWVVAAVVALESMGLPLPGETTLVTAAVYAGTTHELDIIVLMTAAACGAIAGDNMGFWVGRRYGYRLLVEHGQRVGLTSRRIKLGQFLFDRHGGKVVFFGRFIALLRMLAAPLAGINCMRWPRFLFFNAVGGTVWAAIFGSGAYVFGEQVHQLSGPFALVSFGAAILLMLGGTWFVRRHEATLTDEAERALPGPLPLPSRIAHIARPVQPAIGADAKPSIPPVGGSPSGLLGPCRSDGERVCNDADRARDGDARINA